MSAMTIIWCAAGVLAGTLIGISFGLVQDSAARRHQRLAEAGKFNTPTAAVPGSMRRVAYLLVALVLIQLGCPLLFRDGTQWWVSAGVVVGYGMMLYSQLRRRLANQTN